VRVAELAARAVAHLLELKHLLVKNISPRRFCRGILRGHDCRCQGCDVDPSSGEPPRRPTVVKERGL